MLALLVLHAGLHLDDLPQYKDKGVISRMLLYPIVGLLIAFAWRRASVLRQKLGEYPHGADIMITVVLAADLAGNALDLYDSIWWWDDAAHLVMTAVWVIASSYFIRQLDRRNWLVGVLIFSYGVISSVVWEIYEYFAFLRNNRIEAITGYRDTIGDLILAIVGSAVGAFIAVKFLRSGFEKDKKNRSSRR